MQYTARCHTCNVQPAGTHAYYSLLSYMLTYEGLIKYVICCAPHQPPS